MLYLKLKCPHCYSNLMDDSKPLDSKSSVKLKIKFDDKEGLIWLSSLYGSYKYIVDIEIPEKKEVDFYCPECNEKLLSEVNCDICNAHMVPLLLDEGGRVRFCSRKDCVNHSIEFKRPEIALKILYETYTYDGHLEAEHKEVIENLKKTREKEQKEIIKNGTFLYTYCPHCKKTLIKDSRIELKVINHEGETGILHLSPYFNVHEHKSTIRLPLDKAVKDIICPHCSKSIIEDKSCPECGYNIVKILVTASVKLVDFYFCSKAGCKWHGISEEDEDVIMLENSKEW